VLDNATITAFLATTDAPRAKRFYETVLGLQVKSDDEFALAFDCDGIELRIQKVKELRPHPFTALGWSVASARTAVMALVKKGVTFERHDFLDQDDLGLWQAPSGARVAWFKDPDGNLLSLTEVGAP